jgi:TetR/AcrR family transcriptional regulator, transcriptional repressor for nem operon
VAAVPKGALTRQRALHQAAQLLNRHGYLGTPVSELMAATGLHKGGLYNHFPSKEALALEAFDYAVGQSHRRLCRAVEHHAAAPDRLLAFVGAFRAFAADPPIPGGCPVLNAAVEADDAHPGLRARARLAMDAWRDLLGRTVRDGVERGQLRADADPDTVASVIIATLEGAVMLSKLYRDPAHTEHAAAHLSRYIERDLRPEAAAQ